MRKTLNLLLPLILITIVWLSSAKMSFAQGTFTCLTLASTKNCILSEGGNNCSQGYKPGDCAIWNQKSECQGEHTCIPEGVASSCARKLDLLIDRTCPAGFPVGCSDTPLCCKTQENCYQITTARYGCDPGTGGGNDGIITALGCIPVNSLNNFVGWFLSKLIFIASGVAFLLMAFGALQIITSAGSSEKVQAGQQLITSSLAGLIFVILSLFLLRLIGVDILHIPGFGR